MYINIDYTREVDQLIINEARTMNMIPTIGINSDSIKYLQTRNGVAFTADLMTIDGKIGTVENNGNGGDTHAYMIDKEKQQWLDQSRDNADFRLMEHYLDHLMDVAEGVAR